MHTWLCKCTCKYISICVYTFVGKYEHVFEGTTAGVTIQSPQLDINTVAAGGGSRLFFRYTFL
jgi:N-methylhydantoinase A/oxoprolinase/acetone carboxylase beta subunit